MICFGFLIADTIYQEELWKLFFGNHVYTWDYRIYLHASSGNYNGSLNVEQVKTVKSSWEKTMLAQFELMRQFIQHTENTKLCLVSESCIPLLSFSELINNLNHNKSCFSGLKDPWWRVPHHWRVIGNEMIKYCKGHEQWWILDRRHIEIILNNEALLIKWFKNCNADNETYLGTFFNSRHLLNEDNFLNGKFTYTDWKSGTGFRPYTFNHIDEKVLQLSEGSYFLRKITPNTIIDDKLKNKIKNEEKK